MRQLLYNSENSLIFSALLTKAGHPLYTFITQIPLVGLDDGIDNWDLVGILLICDSFQVCSWFMKTVQDIQSFSRTSK